MRHLFIIESRDIYPSICRIEMWNSDWNQIKKRIASEDNNILSEDENDFLLEDGTSVTRLDVKKLQEEFEDRVKSMNWENDTDIFQAWKFVHDFRESPEKEKVK